MKPTQSSTDSPKLIASFTVDGEPISKSRARFTKRGSKTFAYTPEKTKAGEQRVAWAYRAVAKGVPSDTEIAYRVEAEFYNGTRQRRDVDNMVKLILDGLNGVAWVDDDQVMQIEARKSYVPKPDARTDVRVYRIGRLDPPKRTCPGCGSEFRTYDSWNGKVHCTSECGKRARSRAKESLCANCGKQYTKHAPTARFCSVECYADSRRANYSCSECGKSFRDQRSLKSRKNVFCSEGCASARKRRLERECIHGHLRSEFESVLPTGKRYCRECKRLKAVDGRPAWTPPSNCPRGHPFDDENTRYTKEGARVCRQCGKERSRKHRLKLKGEGSSAPSPARGANRTRRTRASS